MKNGTPQVVVPMGGGGVGFVCAVTVFVLLKGHRIILVADPQVGRESVRLWDLFNALQIAATVDQGENLPRSVRPDRLQRNRVRARNRSALDTQAEDRWMVPLEDAQKQKTVWRIEAMFLIMITVVRPMPEVMMIVISAGQQ
ncbi:MAG TPA: hypothetical protein VLI93_15330, partial [Acetobacteraceae bacterium]|nr:hypothetical protein [Acetobacteraceae bacterium]